MHDIHSFGAYVNENADCRHGHAAFARCDRVRHKQVFLMCMRVCALRFFLLTLHLIPLVLLVHFGDKIVVVVAVGDHHTRLKNSKRLT